MCDWLLVSGSPKQVDPSFLVTPTEQYHLKPNLESADIRVSSQFSFLHYSSRFGFRNTEKTNLRSSLEESIELETSWEK